MLCRRLRHGHRAAPLTAGPYRCTPGSGRPMWPPRLSVSRQPLTGQEDGAVRRWGRRCCCRRGERRRGTSPHLPPAQRGAEAERRPPRRHRSALPRVGGRGRGTRGGYAAPGAARGGGQRHLVSGRGAAPLPLRPRSGGDRRERPRGERRRGVPVPKIPPPPTAAGSGRSPALRGRRLQRDLQRGLPPVRAAFAVGKALLPPAVQGWVAGTRVAPRLPPGRVGPLGLPRREEGGVWLRERRLGGNGQLCLLGCPGPHPGYPHRPRAPRVGCPTCPPCFTCPTSHRNGH
ncbi:dapper homolog 3-like [Pipra filicauda]|uniref:Dapper homolog 3-like n=1 Tax=Pipra filicauda TaxID=649802 RepID=A0A7R5K7M2_9PASS|nr:dapper homolog 3-like [Pipra filicauda]